MKVAQIWMIGSLLALAGCSGAGLGGAGDALDTSPLASTPANPTSTNAQIRATQHAAVPPKGQQRPGTQGNTAAKQANTGQQSLPGQQYMSNQVLRSLKELTAEQDETAFPIIADAPPQKRRLLTPEERARVEEELRGLAQ